jgi:single-stranded DNA-specific DHH superfamily exonuclease
MDNLSIDGITAVLMSAVENGNTFNIQVHLPEDSLMQAVALAEQVLGGNTHRQVRINTQESGVIVITAVRGSGEVMFFTQLSKREEGAA